MFKGWEKEFDWVFKYKDLLQSEVMPMIGAWNEFRVIRASQSTLLTVQISSRVSILLIELGNLLTNFGDKFEKGISSFSHIE